MATMTLRKLQEEGHQLILWTVREGKLLDDAVAWCKEHGVFFYAINSNYEGEKPTDKDYSRKVLADIVIDDRNIGGLPHWSVIYQLIHKRCSLEHFIRSEIENGPQSVSTQRKRHWWQF